MSKISRITYYNAKEYPTKEKLEKMLYDNSKGDYPKNIIQVKDKYLWKVVWEFDNEK